MTQANPYDEVPYPSEPQRRTHPDRLATTGVLMGMTPPSVDRCRVLELGCGGGANLLAMALSLPDGEFVGLDLTAAHIAHGRYLAETWGVKNLTLMQRDLLNDVADLGRFDYIIAHGVYSWTPAAVRERVLAICDECLTEQGIAFVSYTVYPGAYHRRMAREMLLYHAPESDSLRDQLGRARDLLTFLADAMPQPERYREILREEKGLLERYGDENYVHDNLGSINHPVYFHEFMAHAARHRLQYLDDSAVSHAPRALYPPAVLDKLNQLGQGRLAREQYRDFLDGRLFRETLLCREGVSLTPEPRPENVLGLWVKSPARQAPAAPDAPPSAAVSFQLPDDETIQTDQLLAQTALHILGERRPAAVSFRELLAEARARSGVGDPDALALAEFLLVAEGMLIVEFSAHAPRIAAGVSERPIASPLARWQISRGRPLTNLWHSPVKMDDPIIRHLFTLLDGTHDRAALADELAEFMVDRELFPRRGDTVLRDPAALRQLLASHMDANLERFARLCLLVG